MQFSVAPDGYGLTTGSVCTTLFGDLRDVWRAQFRRTSAWAAYRSSYGRWAIERDSPTLNASEIELISSNIYRYLFSRKCVQYAVDERSNDGLKRSDCRGFDIINQKRHAPLGKHNCRTKLIAVLLGWTMEWIFDDGQMLVRARVSGVRSRCIHLAPNKTLFINSKACQRGMV